MPDLPNLPKKLELEPLIEVVFEVRFQSLVPASTILPGLFFKELVMPAVERLPLANLPQNIRDANPHFSYAPTELLRSERYSYMIGDKVLVVGAIMPYQGWQNFKPVILEAVATLKNSKIVTNVERFSLKYVDLIKEVSLTEQLGALKLELYVGGNKILNAPLQLRVEMERDGFTQVIQFLTNAQAHYEGKVIAGLVVDVDSIANCNSVDVNQFHIELPDKLESLHLSNKKAFFSTITDAALAKLKPAY